MRLEMRSSEILRGLRRRNAAAEQARLWREEWVAEIEAKAQAKAEAERKLQEQVRRVKAYCTGIGPCLLCDDVNGVWSWRAFGCGACVVGAMVCSWQKGSGSWRRSGQPRIVQRSRGL